MSVKTRYNVQHAKAYACYVKSMDDKWFERFVELIEADGRGMKAISLAAKCGENYVQQMVKNGKRPTVDKFMAILDVLGSASAVYVLTGFKLSSADLEIIKRLSSASAERRKALSVLLDDHTHQESE